VSTREECRILVSRAVEIYDRLDILVNNSSVGLLSPFESLSDVIIGRYLLTLNP
jgi:NAD(P)-dependent dehydrogenase (short-subunit alcohol dehydrogenase family)